MDVYIINQINSQRTGAVNYGLYCKVCSETVYNTLDKTAVIEEMASHTIAYHVKWN